MGAWALCINARYNNYVALWHQNNTLINRQWPCCRLRALWRRRKRFMSSASEFNRSSHECNFTSFGRIWVSQEFSAVVLHPVSCAGFLYAIDMNSPSVEKKSYIRCRCGLLTSVWHDSASTPAPCCSCSGEKSTYVPVSPPNCLICIGLKRHRWIYYGALINGVSKI